MIDAERTNVLALALAADGYHLEVSSARRSVYPRTPST